jgi:hypothetical protein
VHIYIYIYIYGDSKAHAIIPPRFNDSSFFYGSGGDSCSFMELVVRSVKRKHHKNLEFNYDFVHCYIIQWQTSLNWRVFVNLGNLQLWMCVLCVLYVSGMLVPLILPQKTMQNSNQLCCIQLLVHFLQYLGHTCFKIKQFNRTKSTTSCGCFWCAFLETLLSLHNT